MNKKPLYLSIGAFIFKGGSMKIKKFSLVIFLVTCLITNLFVFRLKSFADVAPEYKAVKHNAVFTSTDIPFSGQGAYYTITNVSGLTPCSASYPNFIYTNDNVTFGVISASDVIANIANRGLGILLQSASTFINAYFNYVKGIWNCVEVNGQTFIQDGLYDANHNFYGYALNDISGCYFNGVNPPDITVPNNTVNNVHNYLIYNAESYIDPAPYIRVICPSYDVFISNYDDTTTPDFSEIFNGRPFFDSWWYYPAGVSYNSFGSSGFRAANSSCYGAYYWDSSIRYTKWNQLCYKLELFGQQNLLDYTTLFDYNVQNDEQVYIPYLVIGLNGLNGDPISGTNYTFTYSNGEYSTSASDISNINYISSSPISNILGYRGKISNNTVTVQGVPIVNSGTFDIYMNGTVLDGTYKPEKSIVNNEFYNFSVSNDNSYVTTTQIVSQSQTYNNESFSNVQNSYSEYIDNGTINYNNVSQVVNENIVNYYGSTNDPTYDPDPEPDNPDNPLDWSDLIELIKELLEAIGAVIVGIFEGLISMITQVLQAIANIISNLGGFTDFLSALFGFLPSPVPEVLAAGFSLCVLCAVIKFLRG